MASFAERWHTVSGVRQSEPANYPYHTGFVPVDSDFESQRSSYEKQREQQKQTWLSKLPLVGRYFKTYDTWHPGWLAQCPWGAFGCLFAVIVLSAGAVTLIYLSNGRSPHTYPRWKSLVRPNVLLTIINNLMVILMTMAVGQAVAISWWRRAMKSPATVQELHIFWSFTSSPRSILKHFRLFNIIALTFIVAKLSFIDSILFQKSLGTTTGLSQGLHIPVTVYPAATFPFTGNLNQQANDTTSMLYPMTMDFFTWVNTGDSLDLFDLNGFACGDFCTLTYRGIGFWSNCSYMPLYDIDRSIEAVNAGYNTLFDLQFNQRWPTSMRNYSYIEMNWAAWNPTTPTTESNQSCNGQYQNLTCDLRPAIIDYPITVLNYSVYLGEFNMSSGRSADRSFHVGNISSGHQLPNHTWVQWLDMAEKPTPGGLTNLGGIVTALRTAYNAHSSVKYIPSQTHDSSVRDSVEASGSFAWLAQQEEIPDGCPMGYSGPLESMTTQEPERTYYTKMLHDINMLTLVISDDFQNRANYTGQKYVYDDDYDNYASDVGLDVDANQADYVTIYTSDMKWAWAGFGSTILMVVLILPGFYGYWELGRRVSLDPLEMANAFDAPILKTYDTGAGHVDGLIAGAGDRKVQYNRQSNSHITGQRYHFKPAEDQPERLTPLQKFKVHLKRS